MGKLFIVATPIGNLQDITYRALDILKTVDYIACEDTRVTSKLLSHYNIRKTLISFHAHSEQSKIGKLLSLLENGADIGLVTDAGTPAISDPGGVIVERALEKNIEVQAIPGPSSVAAAISISGFPADKFSFLGFFPRKKGRAKLISRLVEDENTTIFFESPHRILKTLEFLAEKLPERELFVARELTKKFEETYRGRARDLLNTVKAKGEFVIVIRGSDD